MAQPWPSGAFAAPDAGEALLAVHVEAVFADVDIVDGYRWPIFSVVTTELAGTLTDDYELEATAPLVLLELSGTVEDDYELAADAPGFGDEPLEATVEDDYELTAGVPNDLSVYLDFELSAQLVLVTDLPAASAELDATLSGEIGSVTVLAGTITDSQEITGALALPLPLSATCLDEYVLTGAIPTLTALPSVAIEVDLQLSAVLGMFAPMSATVSLDLEISPALLVVPPLMPDASCELDLLLTATAPVLASPTPYPNHFADATVLAGDAGVWTNSTINATWEAGEPEHPFGCRKTLWAKLEVPERSFVHLVPTGADIPVVYNGAGNEQEVGWTVVEVFTGTSLATLELVDFRPHSWSSHEPVRLDLEAGDYYLRVARTTNDNNTDWPGLASLDWHIVGPPVEGWPTHIDKEGALALVGSTGSQDISTGSPSGHVWLTWTAPATANYLFHAVGTTEVTVDTVLVAFDATTGALAGFSDDHRRFSSESLMALRAEAGQTFHIDLTARYGRTIPDGDTPYVMNPDQLEYYFTSVSIDWEPQRDILQPLTGDIEVLHRYGLADDFPDRGDLTCAIASATFGAIFYEPTYSMEFDAGRWSTPDYDGEGVIGTRIRAINPTTGATIRENVIYSDLPHQTVDVNAWRMNDNELALVLDRFGGPVRFAVLNSAGDLRIGEWITSAVSSYADQYYYDERNHTSKVLDGTNTDAEMSQHGYTGTHYKKILRTVDMSTLTVTDTLEFWTREDRQIILHRDLGWIEVGLDGIYGPTGDLLQSHETHYPQFLGVIRDRAGSGEVYVESSNFVEYEYINGEFISRRYEGEYFFASPDAEPTALVDSDEPLWPHYGGYWWTYTDPIKKAMVQSYGDNIGDGPNWFDHWTGYFELHDAEGKYLESMVAEMHPDFPLMDRWDWQASYNYQASCIDIYNGTILVIYENQAYDYLRGTFGEADHDHMVSRVSFRTYKLGPATSPFDVLAFTRYKRPVQNRQPKLENDIGFGRRLAPSRRPNSEPGIGFTRSHPPRQS